MSARLPPLGRLGLVRPTGMEVDDRSPRTRVFDSADLMPRILSAVNAGRPEEACAMVVSWCATRKAACDNADDAFWTELRETIFPATAGKRPPLPPRLWFKQLCQILAKAVSNVKVARRNLKWYEDVLRKADNNREPLTRKESYNWYRIVDHGVNIQQAKDALEETELRLKVARWGRLHPNASYWMLVKDVPSQRPLDPPHAMLHAPGDNRAEYARIFTEDEVRAELDRLEQIDAQMSANERARVEAEKLSDEPGYNSDGLYGPYPASLASEPPPPNADGRSDFWG